MGFTTVISWLENHIQVGDTFTRSRIIDGLCWYDRSYIDRYLQTLTETGILKRVGE